MPKFRAALLAATALAAGCAPVGPDFVRPEAPSNPAWLDAELDLYATSPAELVDWWLQLDDPVLDELIDTARRHNNGIRIAGLRVLEAQAALGIAAGNRFPQTQVLTGDVAAVGISKNDPDSAIQDLRFSQANLSAALAWELDFWGRFRRGIEAADANLLASIASYDEAMLLLVATVSEVYALVRSTEEQLRLARESLKIQQRSYDIVALLYREGDRSELDALQAKTLLLSTQAAIPKLEQALKQAKNALSVLLGMAPGAVDKILAGEGTLPVVPDDIAVGVPADMLRQRPDVRRAELLALAQNALVGVAAAKLYPSFSLSGSLGIGSSEASDTTSGGGGLGELFSSDSVTYAAGGSFVWPFLNYGRVRNNIRVEDARLQQALLAYRQTVLQAAREAEDAMAAFAGTLAQDRIL
ncbi:MAG: efflux transporter outer membrane subunit, partial [Woeseiaceae bacterium]|nr:efflux transporter outer membrane subunit [Woeseiaceae bacterium]